jgi:hypothetical protein
VFLRRLKIEFTPGTFLAARIAKIARIIEFWGARSPPSAVVGALANHIGKHKNSTVTFAIGAFAGGDARGRACSQENYGFYPSLKFYHFALLKTETRSPRAAPKKGSVLI